MYRIKYAQGVVGDLSCLRAYDRFRVLDAIEAQLTHQPTQETRNRKIVFGLAPPWEHVEPIWELRVGQLRVFYDVDEAASLVTVRAVRRKPPHERTEDIL